MPSEATATAIDALRAQIPGPGADRFLGPDLARAEALVWSGEILATVEERMGALT
jgi:histidine ammonia-lyase